VVTQFYGKVCIIPDGLGAQLTYILGAGTCPLTTIACTKIVADVLHKEGIPGLIYNNNNNTLLRHEI